MKIRMFIALILAALLLETGCSKQIYIENRRFILTEGIDLEDDNKVVIYTLNPVFNTVAKDKQKITSSTIETIRESRRKLDAKLNGTIAPGKLQNLLIGKKLLQQRHVLPCLDVFFRDPKNEINANVIVVDGAVKDVVHMNPNDKGRMGAIIKQMVDSAFSSRITVQTSLQKFHQQMKDKTVTPYLTEMNVMKNDLVISGTALLHKDGSYAASLNKQESSLLLLLQRNTKNRIPITIHVPPEQFHTDKQMSVVSFDITKAKVNIKPKSEDAHLTIDILLKAQIELTERLFAIETEKQSKPLEQAIELELKKECEALIKKAQKHQIDPFQLGLYVRAYDYKNWKNVQDNWGKVLSEATVNISPKVVIKGVGVSE